MRLTGAPARIAITRFSGLILVCSAVCLLTAASASAMSAHGRTLRLANPRVNANQSSNWSGYVQGSLEQNGKLFTSVTGDWTVPTVSQHTKGQAEYSSDWIGIGGGCVDSGCVVPDPTLIQTGTEQDVDANGNPSYSAWWEVVPVPSVSEWPPSFNTMTVGPGDHMHASVAEVVPYSDLWKITLTDVTRSETQTATLPYSSSHATAEWIQETPLIIGTGGGFAPLPNLTSPNFDLATTNGRPASLKASEEMQLVDASNHVISDPSAPDPDADGFNVCTWAGTCTAPSTS